LKRRLLVDDKGELQQADGHFPQWFNAGRRKEGVLIKREFISKRIGKRKRAKKKAFSTSLKALIAGRSVSRKNSLHLRNELGGRRSGETGGKKMYIKRGRRNARGGGGREKRDEKNEKISYFSNGLKSVRENYLRQNELPSNQRHATYKNKKTVGTHSSIDLSRTEGREVSRSRKKKGMVGGVQGVNIEKGNQAQGNGLRGRQCTAKGNIR